MRKISALFILFFCFITLQTSAQVNRKISGTVTDTTKNPVSDANILLIAGKDTLKTTTDRNGDFSFKTPVQKFSLRVSMVGYHLRIMAYTFSTDKEKHKQLGPIEMEPTGHMLQEVVIKGKPNPVRFMQDTVEYNAAAFQVMEGDNVADLLKQLPGLEVDDEYRAKTMGKELTKLRVNGEDFFTSNVQEFISRLPAGIVDKIQVIDDFGDEANFTGVKSGEPQKMLNIVTKPGMNKGTFGNAGGNTGTNDMIGGRAGFNFWNKSKQSAADLNWNTLNNGAGESNTLRLGVSHRDKMGKNGTGSFNYGFSDNRNAFTREQVTESLNPEGNFVNNSKSEGENGGNNHSLGGSYSYKDKQIYLQTRVNGTYNRSENQNASISNQYGLIRQDLRNSSLNSSSAPQLNGSINLSKKLKNNKNSFSTNMAFNLSDRNGDQSINTNTLYYDKTTGVLQKDSLLKRNLLTESNTQNLTVAMNYSLGLKKPKDSLTRQSLNLSYSGSVSRSGNEVSTFVFDNYSNQLSFVDSLSTSYRSIAFNQTMALRYNYESKKMRYNLGINAKPNFMTNHDLRLQQKIVNNTFNYSPNLNIGRTMGKGKSLSVSYNGSNINPTINQLQPIRNTVNLQNIVVGNPNLKPAFNHNLNGNFNYVHQKSGVSVQLGLNAAATQREIVEHVILLPDTLNSLKQITQYENINGNFSLGSSYNINIPIFKKKHHLSYSGSAGLSNRAVIFNNQKAFGRGINFSQNLSSNISLKKFMLMTRVGYSVSNGSNAEPNFLLSSGMEPGLGQFSAPAFFRRTNFRTELNGNLNLKNLRIRTGLNYNSNHNDAQADKRFGDVRVINMNLSGTLTIKKSYQTTFSIAKQVNYGYALINANPLLLNATVGKSFLKNKELSLNIQGNDLLGQGNNISRIVSGNTIIDRRNNQQTRVISLNLVYNLSRFGGKSIVVHPDY